MTRGAACGMMPRLPPQGTADVEPPPGMDAFVRRVAGRRLACAGSRGRRADHRIHRHAGQASYRDGASLAPLWNPLRCSLLLYAPPYRYRYRGPVAADGHLTLEEDGTSNDFELARQPDGGWKGTWKNPQGQSLPVLLHPAVLPPLPAGASDFLKQARANKPYVYLRLRTMALVRDKRQSFMGHRLQWWREPGSGIRLFQIEDGYPASQRQRINQALMSELWGNVDEFTVASMETAWVTAGTR